MLVKQFVESEQIVESERIARRGALNLSEMKFSMHSASKNAIWIYLLYLYVHHSINKQRNMRSKNTVGTLLFAFGFKKKE